MYIYVYYLIIIPSIQGNTYRYYLRTNIFNYIILSGVYGSVGQPKSSKPIVL